MTDGFGRSIDYLRISITDRCDLRCVYCMPAGGVPALEHREILRFEEIERLVGVLTRLGVRHLRLTGGEPMARRGCLDLLAALKKIPGVESLSMTSNGQLLSGQMERAKAAGLDGLNLSLDALDGEIYSKLTRGGDVEKTLAALDRALALGIRTKINAIPIRGVNESELVPLALLARDRPVAVRFIELMPLGCARDLTPLPLAELRELLEAALGPLAPDAVPAGHGPAAYWKPRGFRGTLGFISALSHAFCDRCNRVRLTADGVLKLCLNHSAGLDVKTLLRAGASDTELERAVAAAIRNKPARHNFDETIPDREPRRMNEIGG